MVSKIRKRDGRIVRFNRRKIEIAIHKAIDSVKERDGHKAERLSREVVGILNKTFKEKIPSVEEVQDIVEKILIKNKLAKVAKSYILYRQKRAEARRLKELIGVKDELKLGANAIKVLERRYLLKDENGKVIETPKQMFKRVARYIAKAEKHSRKKIEKDFFEMMVNLEFLPNTPTLINAGARLRQLSACFVIPVEDSLEDIFRALEAMALTQQSGGGTGFSFSRLRPKNDIVKTTLGVSSGPVSFIRIFDVTTDVIKQGSARRGANMAILNVDHPDVEEFITAKANGNFQNFNFSVAVTDRFMRDVDKNKEYKLINPRTRKAVKKAKAREIFNLIVSMAWRTGDPGLIFINEINRKNTLPRYGRIEATNPCGEQMLFPWESCNLGSINLAKMVKDGKADWNRLRDTIAKAVHFLDNVIDLNKYPVPMMRKVTLANRKIGLGVMGFAEMLIKLKIPYNSNKAVKTASKLMKFISKEARKVSHELAVKKGSFPNLRKSVYKDKMRNSTLTTIAPTGSISIIAGCSSGIEPLFAVSYIRNVMEGTKLLEVNPYFEKVAKEKGLYSKKLMNEIARTGSVQNIKEIPKDVKKIFVTALDIKPEWHVKMQSAFQKYTDNAVSKTINFPKKATVEDVKKAYLLAYKLKCKGITVYRYGSKRSQVLYIGPPVTSESEYAGGCPFPECPH